jgi:hypothetical protein
MHHAWVPRHAAFSVTVLNVIVLTVVILTVMLIVVAPNSPELGAQQHV